MRFEFVKCHGSGNDFPLIDARAIALSDRDWASAARLLADRRGPVGGDGILLLTAGDRTHAFGMRMFNSDGSESETCLNGLRCVARAGFEALGIARATVRLKTSSADVARAADLAPGVQGVRETAGPAGLDVAAWPMTGVGTELVERAVPTLPTPRAFTAVAMPNPHLVAFVDRVDEIELIRVGAMCEAAPDWLPNRANVSYVAQPGGATLYVRTFERGIGLTDSCGSAMAASTFAAALTGRIAFGGDIVVRNKGGLVRARAERDGMVTLSGNATFEWAGAIDLDLAAGTVGAVTVTRRHDEEVAAWAGVIAGLDL